VLPLCHDRCIDQVLKCGEGIEREMCPWAISKYFGDLVSKQVLKCKMVDKAQTKDKRMFLRLSTLFYGLKYCV
jgi:hypothetical protein